MAPELSPKKGPCWGPLSILALILFQTRTPCLACRPSSSTHRADYTCLHIGLLLPKHNISCFLAYSIFLYRPLNMHFHSRWVFSAVSLEQTNSWGDTVSGPLVQNCPPGHETEIWNWEPLHQSASLLSLCDHSWYPPKSLEGPWHLHRGQ